jgi:hypothetical protein
VEILTKSESDEEEFYDCDESDEEKMEVDEKEGEKQIVPHW